MTTEKSTSELLLLSIAVVGGTGKEGSGLALRWAHSGYRVIIGSRDAAKAEATAEELNAQLGGKYVLGTDNLSAAQQADIVVLSVPYSAHKDTLNAIKSALVGKILIDVTVPLKPPSIRTVHLPEGHAAALEAQKILGDATHVVAAFQNVSAVHLKDLDKKVECDVLVCSDHAEAKADVIRLVEASGMVGIDAGPLANAIAVESLTPVLLYINKHYGVKSSGIRITGLDGHKS
ncbi:MAG: NADPH-dependent F420 reductase [Phototrophicales bacterium]|nr:MAG: NADPH-dependent F420 reductase [Phototrophicales bacterium]